MALVERVTDLGDVGDLSAEPGSRAWAVATLLLIQSHLHKTTSNADHLDAHLRGMREHKAWRHLVDGRGSAFPTYEAFCSTPEPFGLGYDASQLGHIVRARLTAQALALETEALPKPGEIGKGRSRGTNRASTNRSDSVEYLTARIARDRPDVLARMRAGEFASVHQAAIAAGIRKVTVTVPLEPEAIARVLRRRLSAEQRRDLAALLVADDGGEEA